MGGLRRQEVEKTCRRRRLREALLAIMPLLDVEIRWRGRDLKGGATELALFVKVKQTCLKSLGGVG